MNKEQTPFEILSKTRPTQLEMNQEDEASLEQSVRTLLKEDVRSLSLVRKLCKTSDTFKNSLGNLYLYLLDQKQCSECSKKISTCSKNRKGYQYILVYDSDRDEIKTELCECPYEREKREILSRIHPCDCSREKAYLEFNSFFSLGKKEAMKDVIALLVKTKSIIQAYDSEKNQKGLSIISVNKPEMSKELLMATCFMCAKMGVECSYVNLGNILTCLNDRNYDVKQRALADYYEALKKKALFVEDLNNLGNFSDSFYEEYLVPFLRKRDEKGKITFCSLSSSYPLDRIISYKLKQSENLNSSLLSCKNLFTSIIIKDFDMR